MLIWDTGEYSILPYRESKEAAKSSSDDSEYSEPVNSGRGLSESQKLYNAFQQGKIRIRLHGTRLPQNYTFSLRLSKDDYRTNEQPGPPKRRRRKLSPGPARRATQRMSSTEGETDSSSSSGAPFTVLRKDQLISFRRTASPPLKDHHTTAGLKSPSEHPNSKTNPSKKLNILHRKHHSKHNPAKKLASNTTSAPSEDENQNEAELETIRVTNTYPGGATNTISSIHQRRWFLTLDRHNSGFVPQLHEDSGHRTWVRACSRADDGARDASDTFHVLNREVERSVVTGRLAAEILADEGVEGFVPRGGWRAVVE